MRPARSCRRVPRVLTPRRRLVQRFEPAGELDCPGFFIAKFEKHSSTLAELEAREAAAAGRAQASLPTATAAAAEEDRPE